MTADRDVEKTYSLTEFATELRRLADALEAGEAFQIEIEGETVVIPLNAVVSVEHEREDGREEIEFQLVWESESEADEEEDEDEEDVAEEDTDGEEEDEQDVADETEEPAKEKTPAAA